MEKRYTILAVDDTKSNIEILLQHLSPEYDVIPALSGKKGIDIALKKHIDLILLDIVMPEMDGYETCSLLKKNEITGDIPVIFLTGQTDEDGIEQAYDAGGIDYVTKPFRPRELLARIRRELHMQELINDLESSREELRVLAATDTLTGLYNRRSLKELATQLLSQEKREGHQVSLLMADIDKFKDINDNYGHDVGDQVIIALASIMKMMLRESDIVARYGGEEFVIVLPNTPLVGGAEIAEKIRQKVENTNYEFGEGVRLTFSVSIGVAEVDCLHEQNLEAALKRADIALYEAKEGGRNRVVLSWF